MITNKPSKPTPDFPLFPHASGKWCKKIGGKPHYFGRWDDPDGALREYEQHAARKSSRRAPQWKAAVPNVPADFPLQPRKDGRWCKSINGKVYYFGALSDPDAALAKYERERSDLEAGRRPVVATGELSVTQLVEIVLKTKRLERDLKKLGAETYKGYDQVGWFLKEFFGDREVLSLRPTDFEELLEALPEMRCSKSSGGECEDWGLVTLDNFIRRTRVFFNYAADDDVQLIDRPVRFGKVFRVSKPADQKRDRKSKPKKFYEAAEIRKVLDAAPPQLKAMILLGVNCGFGNVDIGELTFSEYDATSPWINYTRSKTGIDRRCPLWNETREAMQHAVADRGVPRAGFENHVFITKYGQSWYVNGSSTISTAFSKLVKKCGLSAKGRSYYALRHVVETIGNETNDQTAVDHIMGHKGGNEMANVYREYVDDKRLLKVTRHIHKWLFKK